MEGKIPDQEAGRMVTYADSEISRLRHDRESCGHHLGSPKEALKKLFMLFGVLFRKTYALGHTFEMMYLENILFSNSIVFL